jgi:hypothetical protein
MAQLPPARALLGAMPYASCRPDSSLTPRRTAVSLSALAVSPRSRAAGATLARTPLPACPAIRSSSFTASHIPGQRRRHQPPTPPRAPLQSRRRCGSGCGCGSVTTRRAGSRRSAPPHPISSATRCRNRGRHARPLACRLACSSPAPSGLIPPPPARIPDPIPHDPVTPRAGLACARAAAGRGGGGRGAVRRRAAALERGHRRHVGRPHHQVSPAAAAAAPSAHHHPSRRARAATCVAAACSGLMRVYWVGRGGAGRRRQGGPAGGGAAQRDQVPCRPASRTPRRPAPEPEHGTG